MEKLCIFCVHFKWDERYEYGMGSTQTGPLMTGGKAQCSKGHYAEREIPHDEEEYRKVILRGVNCPDYEQVKV